MSDAGAARPVRRPRSDAARNRARVSEAALEVLAEQGLGATVGDIAARARVGNATVFRHFPTKADLLAEVAMRWLEDWRGVLEQRLASDPAGTSMAPLAFWPRAAFAVPTVKLAPSCAGALDVRASEATIAKTTVRPTSHLLSQATGRSRRATVRERSNPPVRQRQGTAPTRIPSSSSGLRPGQALTAAA